MLLSNVKLFICSIQMLNCCWTALIRVLELYYSVAAASSGTVAEKQTSAAQWSCIACDLNFVTKRELIEHRVLAHAGQQAQGEIIKSMIRYICYWTSGGYIESCVNSWVSKGPDWSIWLNKAKNTGQFFTQVC